MISVFQISNFPLATSAEPQSNNSEPAQFSPHLRCCAADMKPCFGFPLLTRCNFKRLSFAKHTPKHGAFKESIY
jgi:hypothetical protein